AESPRGRQPGPAGRERRGILPVRPHHQRPERVGARKLADGRRREVQSNWQRQASHG
ncbi:hypothetical protein T484DRAFT_2020164, partial [Baffinella frigidus]